MILGRSPVLLPASVLAVCFLFGAPSAIADDNSAQQSDRPAAGPPADRLPQLEVPAGARAEDFLVEDPDAPRSRAWRDGAGLQTKKGLTQRSAAGSETYFLTQRVIVKTDDLAALRSMTQAWTKADVRRMTSVPGYALVTTRSVREAVELAAELRRGGLTQAAYVDMEEPIALRALPTDPKFGDQWHLHNTSRPLFDVNAEAAWSLGYTGAGVVIGIVDTPIQVDHPDLAANYYPEASQDTADPADWHGTGSAGIAAAVAFNGQYGASMAYGARFSRQVIGSTAENAEALAFRLDLNDIKSNSWGPFDNSLAHTLPPLVDDAIRTGISTGRGGLGTIYVWAAGNGGNGTDRVDYDPYAANRFTISVGSIGDLDAHSPFSEPGSSLMVVTQSSGNGRAIYTLRNNNGQTNGFNGTSASCPLAAGVTALMLEANQGLTWRDVRRILLDTARKNDPNDPSWELNGAGHDLSYIFGYGAVDAGAAVSAAGTWENLPHEVSVDSGLVAVNAPLPDNDETGHTAQVTVSEDIVIEAVELTINVASTYIGDLRILMTGPSGTESLVADERWDGTVNYVDYTFTSFRHLDERSAGTWTVKMADLEAADLSTWQDFRITFYGVPICPGDLDGSGQLDLFDLIDLLGAFGACEGDPGWRADADIHNNGCIDLTDLGEFLIHFADPCPQ